MAGVRLDVGETVAIKDALSLKVFLGLPHPKIGPIFLRMSKTRAQLFNVKTVGSFHSLSVSNRGQANLELLMFRRRTFRWPDG
jgi:hypothetical protein